MFNIKKQTFITMNNLQSMYKNFLPLKVSKYKGLLELAKKYVVKNKIWFYNKTKKLQIILTIGF